ncbi:hypothetical protein ACIQCN_13755 [Pseudarthrobacter sp. NPDC092424]|uniref:hypothetical protein n=1 Tax=Pseudarthrobacter sp. NPDC092424 TaxID=3364415 RepID=UPI0037FCECAC
MRPPKGLPKWAEKSWARMHAESDVKLTTGVTEGFIEAPAEPVEGDVKWEPPSPLARPLPTKMAYEILERECKAMREALAHLSVVLDVMEKTLHDAQTRVTPIF